MEPAAHPRIVLRCQGLQSLPGHADRQGIEVCAPGQLEDETLRQIPRADARRVQHLDGEERLLQLRRRAALLRRQLLQGDRQIAPLVQAVHKVEAQPQKRPRLQQPRLPQLGRQVLREGLLAHTGQIFEGSPVASAGQRVPAEGLPHRRARPRRERLRRGQLHLQQRVRERRVLKPRRQLADGQLQKLQRLPHGRRHTEPLALLLGQLHAARLLFLWLLFILLS